MKARSCSHRGKTGPLCEAHAARERRSQRRRRASRPSATSKQLDGVALMAPTPSTSMRSACSSGRSGRFSSSRLEAASGGYSRARPSVVPPENGLQTVGGVFLWGKKPPNKLYFGPERRDRTQEVSGSSPASSIRGKACNRSRVSRVRTPSLSEAAVDRFSAIRLVRGRHARFALAQKLSGHET